MVIVDINNPIPKYLQIGNWLKELIADGRFKEGEKLPAETELSKMCNVNRNTLRQAISELVQQGLLVKQKGVGTFIQNPSAIEFKHDTTKISSFKDDFGSQTVIEKTEVIDASVLIPDRYVCNKLVLGHKQKVVAIKRLRIGNDIPLIYEENYLPFNVFRDILDFDLTRSLYKIITEHYHMKLNHSKQEIRAINFNETISNYFNQSAMTAGFFMKNLTFNENNVPIDLMYSYFRGDKYRLELDLKEY